MAHFYALHPISLLFCSFHSLPLCWLCLLELMFHSDMALHSEVLHYTIERNKKYDENLIKSFERHNLI